jgi:hypothetical protein
LGDDAGGIALARSCDVLEGGERQLEWFIASGVIADAVAIGEAGVVQVQIAPGPVCLKRWTTGPSSSSQRPIHMKSSTLGAETPRWAAAARNRFRGVQSRALAS